MVVLYEQMMMAKMQEWNVEEAAERQKLKMPDWGGWSKDEHKKKQMKDGNTENTTK
jgi:hypothetical protein